MRQASPWQSRTRRAALTTFTLTRTGALIVATEFDTKKEELDKTQAELDAAKDTVTKKQAELDEAKAADEAAKQKHEELVADAAAKQEEIDKAEATSKSQAEELEKLQQEVRDKDATIEEISSTTKQTQAKLDEVEAAHEATKQSNAEQAKEIESLKHPWIWIWAKYPRRWRWCAACPDTERSFLAVVKKNRELLGVAMGARGGTRSSSLHFIIWFCRYL